MTNKNNYQTTIPKFFWNIMKPYKWWLLLMLQAPIVGAFFTPVNSYALKLIVDQVTQNQHFSIDSLMLPIILFCSASVILEVVWRIANYADYKSQPQIEAEIVNQGYAMLLSHRYQFFQNNLSGKISSKIISLRDKYVNILDTLMFGMVWRILSIIIALALLFSVHLTLAVGSFLWLIIFMPVMFLSKRKGMTYSEKSTAEKQKITGLVNDSISNIANVLFFRARKFERNSLRTANDDFIKCEKNRLKFLFLNHFVIGLFYSALSISVLFLLINLRSKNLISTGDFVMVMGLMSYMIEATWGLLNDADNILQDTGTLRESFDIFKQNNQVFDSPNAQELIITKPTINFQNLTYSYQKDNLVFDNFNLSIKAGQRIGLVGHSGAGKSTLVNLLLKVFNPNSGEILIDGKNIANLTFDSLRENIALIPQDPMLFHRSIFENIAYGKLNTNQEEVVEAAKKAYIHDFITTLPNGYDTLVGERGIKLSGGQRQRIAIARAILKNAPILILDEATSSLDSETETQIQNSINNMLQQRDVTVIAIAHRLSTIKHMDRIVVLDQGKMLEDGSFVELIAKEGRFKELWDHQVNGMVI
jgi:ATP-binding cassette, subfamily B, bacterial